MVAAVSTTPHPKTNNPPKKPARPPLLPNAESDNVPPLPSRKPKSREITSRYMSSTSSSGSTTTTNSGNTSTTSSSSTNSSSYCSPSFSLKRHPSPSAAKTTPSTPAPGNPAATIKRSLSVDRRRPSTPSNSAAANLLVSSKRSLSVSFQGGDTFSRPISRTKPAPEISPPAPATNGSSSLRRGTPERPVRDKTESTNTSGVRKGTPERRRATPVRDKADFIPIDKHRWPGRSREANSSVMTRSLDCGGGGDDRRRLGGSESVVRALGQSMTVDRSKTSLDRRLNVEPTSNVEFDANSVITFDGNSVGGGSVSGTESVVSDVESVSSISSRVVQERGSVAQARGGPRGIMVPARFWQETTNRVRRTQEPKSPVLGNNGVKTIALTPKLNALNKSFGDGSILSPRGMLNSRSLSSPIRGAVRPASPNKPPSRGMVSPSRVRNGMTPISLSNDLSRTPSILSFAAETRRGKVGENRVVDAHLLRLLHNRQLQWRFINARADAAMLAQKVTAEKSLYNAWVTTAKLWHSVKTKRAELQTLRSNLKLHSILKGQMLYLDDWDLMDRDHSSSLSGATEALEASTVRLPVGGGARADIQNVKDAICSAVDVMQGMASSICSLLMKVDQVNSVASELANVTAMERALLGQCKDLLSTLTAMQVKDCSLRTHILQLKSVPSSLTTEVQKS
ncbi:hypothetical protein RHMOL_Rhmol07G0284800 [Rhododendron molle]|uniref:Uncharacterized protein n=1 Tax=Rhododendron molle TaxID=49168 RepID=A0ACC0N5Q7_RHOML|nr:hypothetical protein RHMOL_Rhmol07G0284800 [Rhododendron molle]